MDDHENLPKVQLNELLSELRYWIDTGQRPGGEIPTDDWVHQSFRQVLHELDTARDMVEIVESSLSRSCKKLSALQEMEPYARALLAMCENKSSGKALTTAMNDLHTALGKIRRKSDRPKRS